MRVDQNKQLYERSWVGARYAARSAPESAERAILDRHRQQIAGGRILDLGVGGGRTTSFLLDLSADYIGVDYSREMVERCRGRFPGVRFQVGDARSLVSFDDDSFDFVLFSYNGIDSMNHEDRLQVLSEVRRVLTRAGLFVFSSHNRNFPIPRPWELRHLAVNPLRHPMRFGKRALSYPVGLVNALRYRDRNRDERDYCLSVDSAYMYSVVNYRITAAAQIRQLHRAGFCNIEEVGVDGRWLSPQTADLALDPWIHYVARPSA